MGPLEIFFATIFAFFIFVALVRGYSNELGVITIDFAALFLIMMFLEPNLPEVLQRVYANLDRPMPAPRALDHFYSGLFSLIFLMSVFAAYAGQVFSFPGGTRRGIEGFFTNFLVGALNGYLIAGSLWYFQDAYNYPVSDLSLPGIPVLLELPLTPTAQAIADFLPPRVVPPLGWGALMLLMLFLRVRK
ncbi:MAG: hypothetical protein GXP42_11240 [Chloroflexi bacterium]|nr:hypothetical protein [Chloroflexota bacterium]